MPARPMHRPRADPRRGPGAGLAVALGLLAAACGDGSAEPGSGGGLRFEAVTPVPEAVVAPLESYPARDGSALPVRHYPGPSHTVLILLHGSSYHGRYLAPLAARVAGAAGASVLTPDLRGHGLAPERRGDIDYVDQLEDDLADLIAFARERHPGAVVAVGGHSSGGGLALRLYGGPHAERADGLVLLAPWLGHDAPTTRPGSGGWARPRLPRIVVLSVLDALGVRGLHGATVLAFHKPESRRDGTETLAYSYRLMRGFAPRSHADDLAAVRDPVLALIGADDEALFPEQLAPTLEAHAAGEVEVAIVPGASHLDLPDAPETAERLVAWLGRLRDVSAPAPAAPDRAPSGGSRPPGRSPGP